MHGVKFPHEIHFLIIAMLGEYFIWYNVWCYLTDPAYYVREDLQDQLLKGSGMKKKTTEKAYYPAARKTVLKEC